MRLSLRIIGLMFGLSCLADLARPATVCRVPIERLDEAVQFRLYWFGLASVERYRAGSTVRADCLVGQTLTTIGLSSLHLVLGRQTAGEHSEWTYVQGGFDGAKLQDLVPYFVNIEQSTMPAKRSFAEIWEQNRKTVEDMRRGHIPAQVQPQQNVTATAETYRLPELAPPWSQSQHLLDTKFARRVLQLVTGAVQRNMPDACPCRISVPYFGPSDPLLYVLTEFRDGQVAVDSFHRDATDGEPRQDDFLYHSTDPSHRVLVRRLRAQKAMSGQVN